MPKFDASSGDRLPPEQEAEWESDEPIKISVVDNDVTGLGEGEGWDGTAAWFAYPRARNKSYIPLHVMKISFIASRFLSAQKELPDTLDVKEVLRAWKESVIDKSLDYWEENLRPVIDVQLCKRLYSAGFTPFFPLLRDPRISSSYLSRVRAVVLNSEADPKKRTLARPFAAYESCVHDRFGFSLELGIKLAYARRILLVKKSEGIFRSTNLVSYSHLVGDKIKEVETSMVIPAFSQILAIDQSTVNELTDGPSLGHLYLNWLMGFYWGQDALNETIFSKKSGNMVKVREEDSFPRKLSLHEWNTHVGCAGCQERLEKTIKALAITAARNPQEEAISGEERIARFLGGIFGRQ